MARKKKKDEVENYFNSAANYQTEAEARAVTPEGVKVFCAFDELVPIGKVVPNPGNPNTHPPKQVALLAAIIKGAGMEETYYSEQTQRLCCDRSRTPGSCTVHAGQCCAC